MTRSTRGRRRAERALTAIGAAALVACAPALESRARMTEQVVQRERTVDRLRERGRLFARAGDLRRAAQYLSAAIDRGANERSTLPLLMRVYVHDGRYRVAIARGERYLTQHPRAYRMRYLVGTLHAAVGNAVVAKHHFAAVLSQSPTHADSHYSLALLLRDTERDFRAADRHFRRYLELAPRGRHAESARASLLSEVP